MGLLKLSFPLNLTRSQQSKAISRKKKRNRKRKRKGIDGNLGTNKKNSSDNGGIDKLTDDVLIKILSHMSLKEAVRTSVLAHRWRYLWRFVYGTLRFDHRDTATGNVMERKKFESWVNSVVELHRGRYIEGMVISFQAREESDDHTTYLMYPRTFRAVHSWVHFAAQKEVQRFEMNLSLGDGYEFSSIEMLHGVSSPFCRLRTLRLAHVKIKDEVVHYFLASCPNLEELCIHFSDVTKNLQVIDPPSLRVLEISRCLEIKSLEVSAVNLVSLTYGGGKNSLLLKKIPNLCELTISDDVCVFFVCEPNEHSSYSVQLEKLVLDFQMPTYNGPIVALPDLPQLCCLKRLELQVYTLVGRSLLYFTSLIKASPQLREFRIEMSYCVFRWAVNIEEMPFPEISAAEAVKFVHRNLKMVEMAGYIGCSSEGELLLELFKIGPFIERVVIDTESDYYDDPDLALCLSIRRNRLYRTDEEIGATTRDESKKRAIHSVSDFPQQIEFIVT